MHEKKIVQQICSQTELRPETITSFLEEKIYPDKAGWEKFFSILFLSLGIGFTIAGIIFFFAFNWKDLHKFAKIGIVEFVFIAITACIFLKRIPELIRNCILMGASVAVGILFATYGQIYQTGADSFDFFFAWTLSISLWVIVSNLAPLWLFFLFLIGLTFQLYSEQVSPDWATNYWGVAFLTFYSITLVFSIFLSAKRTIPNWFLYILAGHLAVVATSVVVASIFFSENISDSGLRFLETILLIALGIWYGIRIKKILYIVLSALSLITIFSAYLLSLSQDIFLFFLIFLFVLGSVTVVVKFLLDLQKRWNDENL